MSHRPAWLCEKCRHQLGEVVCGAIRCWLSDSISNTEATSVECPRCHTVNVWRHKVETTAR